MRNLHKAYGIRHRGTCIRAESIESVASAAHSLLQDFDSKH
jgi:hypothetical protein